MEAAQARLVAVALAAMQETQVAVVEVRQLAAGRSVSAAAGLSNWPFHRGIAALRSFARISCRLSATLGTKINDDMTRLFLILFYAFRMFLFIFLLPAAQAILFCLAIGRDPSFLKMAIVNDELDPSQGRVCNYTTDCTYSMFSCRYLRFIDNTTIVQVSYFPFV